MTNIDPNSLNDAAKLRALADDEITPEQAGDVGADTRRVEFERALRESVARSMGAPGEVRAPEGLRASIAAMMREEGASAGSEPAVVETPMGDTTDRSFWSGARRYLAVAAVLALVVTVIGFGVTSMSGPGVPDAPFTITRASDVRSFVPQAHDFSTGYSVGEFEAKFSQRTIDDAVAYVGDYLDGVPDKLRDQFERLEGRGFTFAGLGRCAVPGGGPSVHAYYRSQGDAEPVSVFVQQASEAEVGKFCERHCFTAHRESTPGADADDADNLVVWTRSGFIYYVYSADPDVARAAREAFDAPRRSASLVR